MQGPGRLQNSYPSAYMEPRPGQLPADYAHWGSFTRKKKPVGHPTTLIIWLIRPMGHCLGFTEVLSWQRQMQTALPEDGLAQPLRLVIKFSQGPRVSEYAPSPALTRVKTQVTTRVKTPGRR